MEKHHKDTIGILIDEFKKDSSIQALILGGSIAHGFAKPDSDIDVSIIVSQEEYEKHKKENNVVYNNREMVTYENGYIDGKYMDVEFLKLIAAKGSDPIRYAFKDNAVLFSKIEGLDGLLKDIARYPIEKKEDRKIRFAAQILAWKWYYSEAVKKQNQYLVYLAIQKIILFSGRIVLNANEMLYPYHKWMLEELKKAASKPAGLISDIDELLFRHNIDKVNDYCMKILSFVNMDEKTFFWPNQFLKDSETNWIEHEPPVDDL